MAQTFNSMQFHPWEIFNFSLGFAHLFLFHPWFWIYAIWSLIDNQTFNFFNFTPYFNQLGPHNSTPFADWSLAVNFFNLTLNWPQNFDFLANLPLISINWLGKKKIWSFKIPIFSIKLKLGSQTYFFTN